MKNEKANKLIKKYLTDTCSPEELAMVESWYIKAAEHEPDEPGDPDYQYIELEILQKLRAKQLPAKSKKLWPRITASAAAILIFISFGIYFYLDYMGKSNTQYTNSNTQNDIVPGSNKATLTLADGRKISLTDAKNGELAEQSGIKVTKAADGQLIYTISDLSERSSSDKSQISNIEYNTIETPKGGQYQVNLPDGSKVWLNAASSLHYPTRFTGQERKVSLIGEAYFEVTRNSAMPFRVTCNNQVIEVLGTHFNINSYTDEEVIKTTLLEGSIKVIATNNLSSKEIAGVILKPGQQSQITVGGIKNIKVINVDSDEAVAWKNGYFIFASENIESIMRKVSRWYDVEIHYEGNITREEFVGSVSKYEKVSEILTTLELTGLVNFKIEGRRITVMP